MKRRTKIYSLIMVAVVLLGLAAFELLKMRDTGTVASISVDGVQIEEIDLAKVKEAYDLSVDTEYGHNTVHVEPGSICISDADCPDGICVRTGAIKTGGVPIVCMPHRLVISISGGDVDA